MRVLKTCRQVGFAPSRWTTGLALWCQRPQAQRYLKSVTRRTCRTAHAAKTRNVEITSMTVESVKLRMAMDAARDAGDIARLYALANHCLTTLSAMMQPRNGPANYVTVVPSTDGGWLELCEGSRDRCEGYAGA